MTVDFLDLVHIEISVPDAEEAYQILHNVFGAEKVQDEFVKLLDGEYNKVVHVGLGDVVLQFIQPLVEGSSWDNQLKTKGSGVHNLTFGVESAEEAAKEMERLGGIRPLFTFDLDWGRMIPAELLNSEAGKVFMMNSMEQLGFHLEFADNPFKGDINSVPRPRYVTGHDELMGNVSPMLHIELVTADLEKTYQLLNKVFGSEKVELEFADFLDAPGFMRTIHVNLSNVVLQYQQPLVKVPNSPMGSWYDLLEKNGTYVHNITWIANDLDVVVEKFKKEGIEPLFTFPLPWNKLSSDIKSEIKPVHMMNTMDKLGFYMELGELPSEEERKAFSDLLYIDL
jgi:catechol 2,3-dioxygenase-like lactoylglutathione lyase family enzyme